MIQFEAIPHLFGKVHVSHKCLYAPFNKLELIFSDYEILCLKPSPNKLSILCRELIRSLAKNSNKNIELINKNSNGLIYVPDSLISFIKYPSYLASGEYMLKNEKIVREDGQFELVILNNGSLVIRSAVTNDIYRVIVSSAESIFLHRNFIAFYRSKDSVYIHKYYFDKAPFYRLLISNKQRPHLKDQIAGNVENDYSNGYYGRYYDEFDDLVFRFLYEFRYYVS
jgi:hypothetical protein